MEERVAIEGCYVATVDAAGSEYRSGHLVAEAGRIVAAGPGPVPAELAAGATRLDGSGRLVTPGLVNAHTHLYQWLTRGCATEEGLFGWLAALYPVWGRLTPELVRDSAAANLAWLALTGCTTSTDHLYVFPDGLDPADLLEAEILAARQVGVRFHPTRGSMDLGESAGGLPPDSVVESHDTVLAASEAAIGRWHDPSFGAMTRIAIAPCSPFSATAELMRDSAELARAHGVRLHTHLAETADEEEFCLQQFGRTPAQYAEDLGWLGPDVWLAHCVHLSGDAVARIGATGTAVAHCPTSNGRLGSGIAPVRKLLDAGTAVGLGVDGASSNESGRMVGELHQALLAARYAGGPQALTARDCLRMATMGGASCLGRADELGSLEPGKVADVAVWRVDGLPGAGIEDPVCTLVFGAPALEHLFVGGRPVVTGGELSTADAGALAEAAAKASAVITGRGH
ncbi:MAG TPA: 8-oxoguanine deaminase [Streptosporangiaceae bacterium]